MATVGPFSDENQNTSTRITVDGRKLTYKLSVIQRPERARACGQGAKSTSDRRPVDPPPIVDLVVLEGEEQRDITFTHNANFILFVSLEKARPIAHGRVPHTADNPPVLTGSSVAGMAYLERPSPAGYFIFPDLSVRHEGQYRLEFHLWEHVKDPKDASPDDTSGFVDEGVDGSYYKRRCHVKSSPFSVYSAKKFPGLTESTPLSRTVADQGCRVRIRRDVRMRRRADKSAKDWDSYEEDTAPQRDQRSASPDGSARPGQPADAASRPRSASHNSSAGHYQQLQQASRRSSIQALQPHYSQGYAPQQQEVHAVPSEQPAQAAAHVHPQVASSPSYVAQPPYQQPHMPAYAGAYQQSYMAQPQMVQAPMQAYQPPQYTYPQAQAPPMQAQAGQTAPPNMAYSYMQQPVYDTQMSQARPDGMEYMNGAQPNYHRPAMPYGQVTSPMASSDTGSMTMGASLPPLQKMEVGRGEMAIDRSVPPPSDYASMSARPGKRSFGSTFNMQHINEPLRQGARPDVVGGAMQEVSDGSDEDLDWEALKMSYRRADGTRTVRQWPPV